MKNTLLIVLFAGLVSVAFSQETKNIKRVDSPKLLEEASAKFDAQEWEKAEALLKSVPLGDTLYCIAQYRLAYTYTIQEKYEEALKILESLLELPHQRVGEHNILTLLGNNYSETEQLDKAVEIYNKALKIYPYHYNTHYNKGIVYGKMERYDSAYYCSKAAIFCNPTHQASHYLLGTAYLRLNCFVPGILALNYAILINPTSAVATRSRVSLDNLYAEGLDAYNEQKETAVPDEIKNKNSKYQVLESLIKSNFVLAKGYKLRSSIDHLIIAQNQLIFESINENLPSAEIEDQLYIPTFKMIMKEKKGFDVYSHIIMRGTNLVDDKKTEKLEKPVTAMYRKIVDLLKESAEKGLGVENKDNLLYTFYNDFNLESFGKYTVDASGKKTYDGKWTILNEDGHVSYTMHYNKGVQDGVVNLFDDNGNTIGQHTFKNGVLEGEAEYYHYNDSNKRFLGSATFKNGLLTNVREQYNRSGILIEKAHLDSGLFEGLRVTFYPQGKTKDETDYHKGEIRNMGAGYYEDGKTIRYNTVPGENGDKYTLIYYYPDGTPKITVVLSGEKYVGDYRYFYSDGTLQCKGQYDEHEKPAGQWTEYHPDGKTLNVYTYEKGKKHGEEEVYSVDGRLTAKIVWKNGIIQEIVHFNADGSEKERRKPLKDKIVLDIYFFDGDISYLYRQMPYKANGNTHGKMLTYTPSGSILSERNYKDNQLDGVSKLFYPNGKLEKYTEYKNDVVHGLVLEYNENNVLISEGYYHEGSPAYIDYTYFPNGSLSSVNLYDGTEPVNSKNYFPDGSLSSETFYKHGLTDRTNHYDQHGKLLAADTFSYGNGEKHVYYLNGRIQEKGTLKANALCGDYICYNFNGEEISRCRYFEGLIDGKLSVPEKIMPSTIAYEGHYILGNAYGKHKWNHFTENCYIENYRNNISEDTCLFYHENGNLAVCYLRNDDERNGITTGFAADGKTVCFRLKYNYGQIYAYSYMDKDGKMTDFQLMGKEKVTIVSYYPNGKKSSESSFENYLRQGKDILYFPNGKVFKEVNFVDGNYEGEKEARYENGNLRYKEYYKNDMLNGKCEYYHSNGKPKLVVDYVDDFIHGTVELYDEAGKPIQTQKWFYNNRLE
jgi:antitoxin component YwqK of YwqJK toxin-antitoxin module